MYNLFLLKSILGLIMPKYSIKKLIYVILVIYLSCSIWVFFSIFKARRTKAALASTNKLPQEHDEPKTKKVDRVINVWGKAAIAEYLWGHIFEGKLTKVSGLLLKRGSMTIDELRLAYTTGPSLIVETADKQVEELIIVLNGREQSKVELAKFWLDALTNKEMFFNLRNLGIIILGNELCDNNWLSFYIDGFPNLVKFTAVVYDYTNFGTRPVYQWPLGVATYRNFPLIMKARVDVTMKRKYKCNFLGTVYANSSRQVLMTVLKEGNYNCYVRPRETWWAKETYESRNIYHDILQNSDLTLCPVGINSESYRIYEALSYGSVPVLEDVLTPGECGTDNKKAPFLLLKEYNAPVIYVKDWKRDLPGLLQIEARLSDRDIIKRRKAVLAWYEVFRYKMRVRLLDITRSHFK